MIQYKQMLCAAALGSAALAACSGDEEVKVTPRPPPTLTLQQLAPVGGPVLTPGSGTCLEQGRDANGTVVVSVSFTDFVLRPPGLCGGSRCGRVVVRVDPTESGEALRVEGVSPAIDLPLADLELGSRVIRVELVDDQGRTLVDKDDAFVGMEIAVQLVAAMGCSAPPADAGADADSDAGADAQADADAGADAEPDGGDATADAPADAADDHTTSDADAD